MAKPQTKHTDAPAPAAPPYEFDRDNPWVVVSQRKFCFSIPSEQLGGEGEKRTRRLWTNLGAGFLCADVTSWNWRSWNTASNHPPRVMPDEMRQQVSIRCDETALTSAPEFLDDERPNFAAVEETLLGAFSSIGWGRESAKDSEITASRFVPRRGCATPEIVLIRAKDIFEESENSRNARAILEQVIPYSKDGVHLGALHDFAVMASYMGRTISDKCRARGRLFGING